MLTARDCQELGIIDQVVPEPDGGSHNDRLQAASDLNTPYTGTLPRRAACQRASWSSNAIGNSGRWGN